MVLSTQRLIDARYELDKLAFDEAVFVQEITAFFALHTETLTPQQAPALLLLQRKVEQMKEELLAAKLKKILEQLSSSSDPDDLFLTELTKMVCNPQNSADQIRQFLQTAKTPLQLGLKERWNAQSPEKILKIVLFESTSQCVTRASLPFFQACAAKMVNPFSVMCAKKEIALAPTNGYSVAHAAALETDTACLEKLFHQNPAQFDLRTPLEGTVWDLLRARGHALPADRPITYPFGIPRRYLSQSILMPEICQELMSLQPVWVDPQHQSAFHRFQERKKRGEQDPLEIFPIQNGPMVGQFGARASRKIEAGEMVSAYRGEITSLTLNRKNICYAQQFQTLLVQALDAGSMGEMLNHGPPNCAAVTFQEDGMPCLGLIALREIAQGEELFQNYEQQFFLHRQFIELAPSLVDDYLKVTDNLSATFLPVSKDRLLHHMNYHRAMLCYICHFPHRAFEWLKQPGGRELAVNWCSLLDSCAQANQLPWLRIGSLRYEALKVTIQVTMNSETREVPPEYLALLRVVD